MTIYTKPMVAAIYARVSTPGQREEGTSLDTQVEACLKIADDKELHVPPQLIFQEQASGADSNRPLLSQVRSLARERRIDTLIIYHPDRLSCDATDLMVISEEITEAGVEIVFIHGPSGDPVQRDGGLRAYEEFMVSPYPYTGMGVYEGL